jgi:acetyl esterase/lipase
LTNPENGSRSPFTHEYIAASNRERFLSIADALGIALSLLNLETDDMTHWHARLIACGAIVLAATAFGMEIDGPKPTRKVVYKQIGDVTLELDVFDPEGLQPNDKRPAIIFFFGGGWNSGSPTQFSRHAAHFAKRGMVAICADYRVKSRHGVTPFECVRDAKSAVRWVRAHAAELGVDPDRIVASGGSAGGHLAACAGVIDGLDEEREDTAISSRPNALILFNPVIDTGIRGYGNKVLAERARTISPVEHVTKDVPPTIIFHGDADTTTPIEGVRRFRDRMKTLDRRCDLVEFSGEKHGFFNRGKAFEQTLEQADAFLVSLGYLDAPK